MFRVCATRGGTRRPGMSEPPPAPMVSLNSWRSTYRKRTIRMMRMYLCVGWDWGWVGGGWGGWVKVACTLPSTAGCSLHCTARQQGAGSGSPQAHAPGLSARAWQPSRDPCSPGPVGAPLFPAPLLQQLRLTGR